MFGYTRINLRLHIRSLIYQNIYFWINDRKQIGVFHAGVDSWQTLLLHYVKPCLNQNNVFFKCSTSVLLPEIPFANAKHQIDLNDHLRRVIGAAYICVTCSLE